MPRSNGCVVVSYTAGTAPQSATPPGYFAKSSVRMSFSAIGGRCAVRQAVAGLPYFAVASARCLRHQYRVPPSRRLPTETIWHALPSGIGVRFVPKRFCCSPARCCVAVFFMEGLLVPAGLGAFEPGSKFEAL